MQQIGEVYVQVSEAARNVRYPREKLEKDSLAVSRQHHALLLLGQSEAHGEGLFCVGATRHSRVVPCSRLALPLTRIP